MEERNAADPPSPKPANGIKKAYSKSNLSHSTLSERDDSALSSQNSRTPSFDEAGKEKSRSSTGGAERDAAPSGLSKLMPGARRRLRKKQEAEAAAAASQESLGGTASHGLPSEESLAESDAVNTRRRSFTDPGVNPLGHGPESGGRSARHKASSPSIVISTPQPGQSRSPENPDATSEVDPSEASTESTSDPRARGLEPSERARKLPRSPSSQRLSGSFASSSSEIPRPTSPDRSSIGSAKSKKSTRSFFKSARRVSLSSKKGPKPRQDAPPIPKPSPVLTAATPRSSTQNDDVTTPTNQAPHRIMTTISPPTPTDEESRSPAIPLTVVDPPEALKTVPMLPPNAVVSSSGNMISHRRVRSASAAQTQTKSSNGVAAPSTPQIEEAASPGSKTSPNAAGSFFSSMFSAAQTAASTLSNSLNAQSRMRSLAEMSETALQGQSEKDNRLADAVTDDELMGEKKQLAIDTLGSGDLDFSHLGIDTSAGGVIRTDDGVVFTKMEQGNRSRKSTISQRDALSATLEDARAARAVSMAYEKAPDSAVTMAESTQTETKLSRIASRIAKDSAGDQTPPNGSMVGSEVGDSARRSGSPRRRRSRRRRRRSTGATGSTIGAIGTVVGGLAFPGAPLGMPMPRLTGFAIASKKRNRDFHQLFRSVPEDDYLIEDYSCALQREIILAGRIYISEGHICFSSNILGWVTTLVIGFDEVVAIEKESTAMVFPNAIAIKTLHARHIFRSLLSRDSTYDLMVNIWKINHPTLKSSLNGTQIAQGTGDKTEKADASEAESSSASEEEEEVYDEDEEADAGIHGEAVEASVSSSDQAEPLKPRIRHASTLPATPFFPPLPTPGDSDTKPKDKTTSSTENSATFPGPKTHAPTEFTDPSGYYDKLITDDIIPAPLGHVYSLVFGPASGSFISKFLTEVCKCTELQLEDDKKGLTNENRTRTYSYIKPLNGAIGPRQTKCISTENLDLLDLEKAVLVTLTTQTPDVPSGNAFSVKTKYLFTWAPGNATRFYMTCTIEWTGKSWIKGPVEKGANDGQLTFGVDLVKALKQGVAPRARGKGTAKGKGKRVMTELGRVDRAAAATPAAKASGRQTPNWGLLEPLRSTLGPLVDIFRPLINGNFAIGIICVLLFMMWFRTPTVPSVGRPGGPASSLNERTLAYEELWRREESDLWEWLESRVGMEGIGVPIAAGSDDRAHRPTVRNSRPNRPQGEKDMENLLRDEKMTEREIEDAIRITNERLETLQRVVEKRKRERHTKNGN